MDASSIVDGYHVVLSEESRTRLQLFEKWLPGVSIRTAQSVAEFRAAFDERTAVACLSRPLLGPEEPQLRTEILATHPHCQLVLLCAHGRAVPAMTQEYDASLRRPIYRRDLQDTIETQLQYGVYRHTLHEFYSLNAKLARFGNRDRNDPREGIAIEHLNTRYRVLKEQLDTLQATIGTRDIDAIVDSLKRHHQHLTEPATDGPRTRASKYHPDRCPNCALPWGVDHRNKLGTGCDRVGAYVWRCTRCNEITHGLGSSHRRVLR